jgi:hypothetical protein
MTHLTAELAYWINERQAIHEKRLRGLPAPWSEDPIFQTVRFCNVHREDDTVTQWIRKYWNKPDDPAWKFVLGRMINLPESLDYLRLLPTGDDPFPQLDVAKEILKTQRSLHRKIFTSAYTISTCGQKMDKLDYVFGVVAAVKKWEERVETRLSYHSLEEMAGWLESTNGLGTFLAGQVIADMKNTDNHPLQRAPDWWTWSAPGPGSLRGLSWYFYGKDSSVTPSTYHDCMNVAYTEVSPLISCGPLHMQDFQSCFCEFSKMMKVKNDPGAHVRNRVHYV